MLHYIRTLIVISSGILCIQAAADQPQKTVTVVIGLNKPFINISFDDTTRIKTIRDAVADAEEIPHAMLQLYKQEWTRINIAPKKVSTALELDKTCADYNLQHGSELHGYLTLTYGDDDI